MYLSTATPEADNPWKRTVWEQLIMPDEEQPQTRIHVFTNEWLLIESGTQLLLPITCSSICRCCKIQTSSKWTTNTLDPHIKCRWHDSRPLPEPYNGPFVFWICWDNPAGQPSRHNQHTQRSMQCCCPLNNIRFCITCAVFAVCHRVVAEEPHVDDACSANVAIAAAFTVAAV